MAQFIPQGWRCSPQTNARLKVEWEWIKPLVKRRARRYFALAAINEQDLFQEGTLAATYALDTYVAERGKLKAYVGRCVENALAMVACESRAQRRHPYTYEREGEQWVRVSAPAPADPDTIANCDYAPDTEIIASEERVAEVKRQARSKAKVAALRAQLTAEANMVLSLRLNPPAELVTLARNLSGRNVGPESRINSRAVAAFTGMSVYAVDKAIREIKNVVNAATSR